MPNYTRRMLWVFVGQLALITALFIWNDIFLAWVNRLIAITAILFPLAAYLIVFAHSSVRQTWKKLFRDLFEFAVLILPAIFRLFSFATIVKLFRLIVSLKAFPETTDDWINFALLPFKTFIVVGFPFVWVCLKIAAYFHPIGREIWEVRFAIGQGYFLSLLALLLGALIQTSFCRAGRTTTTLLFFVLGILWLVSNSFLRL